MQFRKLSVLDAIPDWTNKIWFLLWIKTGMRRFLVLHTIVMHIVSHHDTEIKI